MGPQNIAYPGAPKQMGQNAFQPQQYFPKYAWKGKGEKEEEEDT